MRDKIDPDVKKAVQTLQNEGFETYIVGGAVRDILLNRKPKDYDVSTTATPEEVRQVFGRKNAVIIGKRFRIVHLRIKSQIIEISTFRALPPKVVEAHLHHDYGTPPAPKIIRNDNVYGTPKEDAFRRDFTVNALFYNPTTNDIVDHTKQGLPDLKAGIIRVIGDPRTRFEEDPVRLLRALKLLGQYGFQMENETALALGECMSLISMASPSRLTLELEKILRGSHAHKLFRVFHEYGLLKYFLPWFDDRFDTEPAQYALELLRVRNERIQKGKYRESLSVALGCLSIPFIEEAQGQPLGGLWEFNLHPNREILAQMRTVMRPHAFCQKVTDSLAKIVDLQPDFLDIGTDPEQIMYTKSYPNARELFLIQNEVAWLIEGAEERFPSVKMKVQADQGFGGNYVFKSNPRLRKKKNFGKKPERYSDPYDGR